MAWTSPRTWVANVTAITALALNTDLRDNLNYLKGLLDGTGADNVTVPANLRIANDAAFELFLSGGNPWLELDTDDALVYNRASDIFLVRIGGTNVLQVASNGKLIGSAFYDSGQITAASGAGVQTALHGLGARPRVVAGIESATSGVVGVDSSSSVVGLMTRSGGGSVVNFSDHNNSNIRYTNSGGSTMYIRIFAML